MTGLAADAEHARWQTEVLRRASAILGGKLVGVWEVRPDQSLAPVASNMPLAMAQGAGPKVREALRRIHMPYPPGSRWVGGQSVMSAGWCVAPVRTRAPDPPAHRERRSRGRLALELAGLCLGLSEMLAADGHTKELETAELALDDTTFILGRSPGRTSGVVGPSGGFELVPVVRSAVDAARGEAAERGASIDVEALGPVAPVSGDAGQLRRVLALLLHNAVLALSGRPGTVALTLADVGPVVRITIHVPALITESAIAAARHVVETGFGGDLSASFQTTEPATVVMLRLAATSLPPWPRSRPRCGRGHPPGSPAGPAAPGRCPSP